MAAQQPTGEGPGIPPSAFRRWRRGLARPLNLTIVLVCAASITGIWLATLQRIDSEREQAVASTMKSNANLAIAFEQHVFRTLKAAEQVAAFVREQYLQHPATINLPGWATQRTIRETMFTVVSVVDETGTIIVSSSGQRTEAVNYADRDFFRQQRDAGTDELFINQPVFGRISNRWQIPMSLRITRPDGSFGGVVVMSVDPDNFTDFHRQTDLGRRGLLELTGLDGVMRGRKIGNESSFGLAATGLPWFQRQATAPEGEMLDDGATLDGVPRIVSYRNMAGYPLMAVVGTPVDEALAPVRQRSRGYVLAASSATAVLLVFAALLMLVLARQRLATEALQASEALFRATFHQAATGIAHIAPDGRILRANEKFCRMLGYGLAELSTHTLFDLSDEGSRDEARRFLRQRLSEDSPVFAPEVEQAYRRKDGTVLWVCEALGVVKDARGQPEFLVAVTQDITPRKELETRLSHEALHDALTGLPNRVMFHDRLNQALLSARRAGTAAAVLYIDLDGFKAANDEHGHAAGDRLLQLAARRLEACVRSEDTVARLGGDEFGLVLKTLTRAEDCERVAIKVINALAEPFVLEDGEVCISASVGVAAYPTHGENPDELVAHADAAMYAAKHAGKNRFSWDARADLA